MTNVNCERKGAVMESHFKTSTSILLNSTENGDTKFDVLTPVPSNPQPQTRYK
jgi:hypothetical protein